jgi:hypothetical protein
MPLCSQTIVKIYVCDVVSDVVSEGVQAETFLTAVEKETGTFAMLVQCSTNWATRSSGWYFRTQKKNCVYPNIFKSPYIIDISVFYDLEVFCFWCYLVRWRYMFVWCCLWVCPYRTSKPKVTGSIPTAVKQTFQLAWCAHTQRQHHQHNISSPECITPETENLWKYCCKFFVYILNWRYFASNLYSF